MQKKGKDSPNFKDKTGEHHWTKEGEEVEIIAYRGKLDCDILFLRTGNIITNRTHCEIKKGKIKNPYYPSVYGVGYIGEGVYKCYTGEDRSPHYKRWMDMLKRCYSEKHQQQYPSYRQVSVCNEWHNFQNFASWFEETYKPHMRGWALDKDIFSRETKTYSPETCCFVPEDINNLFTTKQSRKHSHLPLGVTYSRSGKKYVAQMTKNGRTNRFGSYGNVEEAEERYNVERKLYLKEKAESYKDVLDIKVYNKLICK